MNDERMTASLFITRDSGFADFVRKYKVVLDGEEIGVLKNGGTFGCTIASGKHALQLKVDWCGSDMVEFNAVPGEQVQFQCGSNLRGWKLLKASKVMRESPYEWIWLKQSSNKTMQATCEDARA